MNAGHFKVNLAASIRGVTFHIDTGNESGGHRKVDHAYPNRDAHYIEDLGWKSDYFDVRGYITDLDVAGDKIRTIRNALKSKGVCSFYHPLLDEMFQVEVFEWSIDTRTAQIGRVDFSFKAAKVNADQMVGMTISPVSSRSPIAALEAASDSLTIKLAEHLLA